MLFLDTEFNGFHGELISMAIVPDFGEPFYEVRFSPTNVHKWVQEHVIPVLNKEPITDHHFQLKLWHFLKPYNNDIVIADWPEDFAHLMRWLCEPGGIMPNVQLRMHLIKAGELTPDIPHNALSDARALQKWYHE